MKLLLTVIFLQFILSGSLAFAGDPRTVTDELEKFRSIVESGITYDEYSYGLKGLIATANLYARKNEDYIGSPIQKAVSEVIDVYVDGEKYWGVIINFKSKWRTEPRMSVTESFKEKYPDFTKKVSEGGVGHDNDPSWINSEAVAPFFMRVASAKTDDVLRIIKSGKKKSK